MELLSSCEISLLELDAIKSEQDQSTEAVGIKACVQVVFEVTVRVCLPSQLGLRDNSQGQESSEEEGGLHGRHGQRSIVTSRGGRGRGFV